MDFFMFLKIIGHVQYTKLTNVSLDYQMEI